jgi:hypothetical protein
MAMMVIATTLAKFSPVFALAYAENMYMTPVQTKQAFGLVILSNVLYSAFSLLALGTRVGKARKDFDVPLPALCTFFSSFDIVNMTSIYNLIAVTISFCICCPISTLPVLLV